MLYIMLGAVLFCLLLVVLVLLGKQYLLYKIGYIPFLFSKERKCYKQFKKVNAKTEFRKMQSKTLTFIFKEDSTSMNALLEKCGMSEKDILQEEEYETFQAYLIGDHVLLVSNTSLISNAKKLRIISRSLHYFAKNIKKSATMISELNYQEDSFIDEDDPKDKSMLPNAQVINDIIKWSKAVEIYTTWFTGVENFDGYKQFLHFGDILRDYPSFIHGEDSDLALSINNYFSMLHNKLTKTVFLQQADKISGAYVFIDCLHRGLMRSLDKGLILNKLKNNPSVKNMILMGLFKVNKKMPLNFIQYPVLNTKKVSGILMAIVIFILLVFIGLFYTSAYKFRQGTLGLDVEGDDGNAQALNSKAISVAYAKVQSSKFTYFYSIDLLMGRRFESIANYIINNKLSKKMLDTKNLYIASLSLAVSSAADSPKVRDIISTNEFLISNVLEIPSSSVIILAAQNYYLAKQLPDLDIDDYNWVHSPTHVIEKYNQYYKYLVNNPELPFNNYIKFLNEYYLDVKKLKILKDMLGNQKVNNSLSKENLAFQTEVKKQIHHISKLPADDVMAELKILGSQTIKSTNEYANSLQSLLKLYRKYKTLREDENSDLLSSAITSYTLNGANDINEYSLPIVYTSEKRKRLSVNILTVGDFNVDILMMYTASFYKQLSETLTKLGDVGVELNKLGLDQSGDVVLNIKGIVKNKYAQNYIDSNLKDIDELNNIDLNGVSPEVILALYSTPNSQFFQALDFIRTNTQFSKEIIKKDPLVKLVDDRFKLFNSVIGNKKFILAYQAIISDMAYNYKNNQASKEQLLNSMLTLQGDTKSPLLKLQELLKKNNIPQQYWPMFTAPIRLVMLYLRPVLLQYIESTWLRRIHPIILNISADFPFTKGAKAELSTKEFEENFGPNGAINNIVTSAYIPFLELKNNEYVIRGVSDKDVPAKIKKILHFITIHRNLISEMWDANGNRKDDILSVTPIQIPQKSIKGSYVVASYFNVGSDFMVNLPLNQNGKNMKYEWFNADTSVGVGWYGSENKEINSVSSFSGSNALFHLLYSADESQNDIYVWNISDVKAIKFKIKSPFITFIKEVFENE